MREVKKTLTDGEYGKDVGLGVWGGESYLEAQLVRLPRCPLAPPPDGSQELGDRGNGRLRAQPGLLCGEDSSLGPEQVPARQHEDRELHEERW